MYSPHLLHLMENGAISRMTCWGSFGILRRLILDGSKSGGKLYRKSYRQHIAYMKGMRQSTDEEWQDLLFLMVKSINKESFVSTKTPFDNYRQKHSRSKPFAQTFCILPCKGLERRKGKDKGKLYLFKSDHSRWWRQRRRIMSPGRKAVMAEYNLLLTNK